MNKPVAILWFFSLICSLSAQQIEVYGGVNHQTRYGHSLAPDQPLSGGIIGLGFSPLVLDNNLELRVTGSLNSYHGTVRWGSGGHGGSSSTVLNTKNYDIGIGAFPFNVLIIKHIHLNIGTELKILISDQSHGYTKSWSLIYPDVKTIIIGEGGRDIFPALNFGVIGRIAYEIRITDSVSVLPQYSIYLGLTDEFKDGPDGRSLRQYFCLGVSHTLR